MFYTNGVILIESSNDLEKLSEAIDKLERWFEIERGIAVSFELDTESDFPAYTVPEGVSYNDMYDCLTPELSIRGINGDILKMPEKKIVSVKHHFEEEEMISKSSDQSGRIMEIAKLKQEKAAYNKRMGAKISELEDKMNNEAQIMAQGYEFRDESCDVLHNFEEKRVYYMSSNKEGVCIKSREMEKKEMQMQMFVEPVEGDWSEKEEETEQEDAIENFESSAENTEENANEQVEDEPKKSEENNDNEEDDPGF